MKLIENLNLKDWHYIRRTNGPIRLKEGCIVFAEPDSLSDAREFQDPRTARSSVASHVPSQPLTTPEFQRNVQLRLWIAAYLAEYCGFFRKLF